MCFRVLLLFIFICFHFSSLASADVPLTAAFIRDHQLWIKKEIKKSNSQKDNIYFLQNGHKMDVLLRILMAMSRERNQIYTFMTQRKKKASSLM
ncbi:Ser/Thr protein kinase RdoA (MazF antagonist) [Bacillus niacini]|uniref:Ser/Thr protein kinase RdoA (MazF antagonist) n=1 Tax=Neobacillus niacini TaxID=86668 RepID=A0A852T8B1_9BACI|nr:Ser/Thr protein kinase RdoA (MazF antagonist) [Neobacillus niacini]